MDPECLEPKLNLMFAEWRTGQLMDHQLLDRIHSDIGAINPTLATLVHILVAKYAGMRFD